MGALVAAPSALDRLVPAGAGWFSFERGDSTGDAVWWADARRFESSNYHRPSIVGMARSLGWLSMYVGLDYVHRTGMARALAMAHRLAAIRGVTVLTPTNRMATLVTFRIAGWTAQSALDELGARVFAIARTIGSLEAIRLSVGFFNTSEELERLAEVVELLAAHTPDTLPPRRRLTILDDG
jgi:selenocysteine lyase/cysteine desulfurase